MEGKKFDTGKLRWSLLPAGVLRDVIKVLEHGAIKYGVSNWQHVPDANRRYYDAAMRHIDEWQSGGENDAETGESHLAHAVCCLMFLMWLEKNRDWKDDVIKITTIEHPTFVGEPSEYMFSPGAIEDVWLTRDWQGLTDEDVDWVYQKPWKDMYEFAHHIEAKLKEKNT